MNLRAIWIAQTSDSVQRKGVYVTRLETRTKESNDIASVREFANSDA